MFCVIYSARRYACTWMRQVVNGNRSCKTATIIWNSTNTRGFIQGQHQSSQHVSQSRLSFLICPILLGVDQNGKSLVGQFDDEHWWTMRLLGTFQTQYSWQISLQFLSSICLWTSPRIAGLCMILDWRKRVVPGTAQEQSTTTTGFKEFFFLRFPAALSDPKSCVWVELWN